MRSLLRCPGQRTLQWLLRGEAPSVAWARGLAGEDDPCQRQVGLNVPFLPRHSVRHLVGGVLCHVDSEAGIGGKVLASPKLAVTFTLLFGVRVSSTACRRTVIRT